MRIFHKFFPTLLLCISLCLTLWAGKPVDVLFCAYDTGDSNIILRLLPELKKKRLSYAVLAFGRGAEIFKDEKAFYKVRGGSVEDRAQILPEGEISYIQEEFEPKIVFTGMASVRASTGIDGIP
jgi:hypothetical protein